MDTAREWYPQFEAISHLVPDRMADLKSKITIYDEVAPALVAQMQEVGTKSIWQEWASLHPEAVPLMDAIWGALGRTWR